MSRDSVEKRARVLLAHGGEGGGGKLASAAALVSDLDVEELVAVPDEIWKQAISHSCDLVVLFFPELGEEHERCIRRILRGCLSRILLLTGGAVSGEFTDNTERVEVYLVPRSKTNFDDVISHMLALCGKKRAVAPAARRAQEDADTREQAGAAVLAEGALAAKLVAIGASTGGTEALATLFRGLRPKMPGIVVVQHMPPGFTGMFAERLDRELPFNVCEARDNNRVLPGSIHIAPGDRQMTVKKVGSNYVTVLGGTEKVSGHCPSVDVLFESVAKVAGSAATGVILTGMGGDGAKGLLSMRKRGAYTFGQDEQSCVVYGMPRKAFELGAVVKQAALRDIGALLMAHLGTGG